MKLVIDINKQLFNRLKYGEESGTDVQYTIRQVLKGKPFSDSNNLEATNNYHCRGSVSPK